MTLGERRSGSLRIAFRVGGTGTVAGQGGFVERSGGDRGTKGRGARARDRGRDSECFAARRGCVAGAGIYARPIRGARHGVDLNVHRAIGADGRVRTYALSLFSMREVSGEGFGKKRSEWKERNVLLG